ncbi:hypothetical protein MHYP_G00321710 [Metynnis hypsauchen]
MSAPGTPWKSIAESEHHVLLSELRAEISVRRSPGPAQFIRPTAPAQRSSSNGRPASGARSPLLLRSLPAGGRTSLGAPGSRSTYMAHGARARQHSRVPGLRGFGGASVRRCEPGSPFFFSHHMLDEHLSARAPSSKAQPFCSRCCCFSKCDARTKRLEQKSSFSSLKKGRKKAHIILGSLVPSARSERSVSNWGGGVERTSAFVGSNPPVSAPFPPSSPALRLQNGARPSAPFLRGLRRHGAAREPIGHALPHIATCGSVAGIL